MYVGFELYTKRVQECVRVTVWNNFTFGWKVYLKMFQVMQPLFNTVVANYGAIYLNSYKFVQMIAFLV